MKILVAGACGVIGRSLVPMLVWQGHDVIGLTRSQHKGTQLIRAGVQPIILDVFDRDDVFSALQDVKPDTVIHQLTSLRARDFVEHARIEEKVHATL